MGRQRRQTQHRRRLTAIGLSGLTVVGLASYLTVRLTASGDAHRPPVTISGEVICVSSAPVVGVWIQTAAGADSYWAQLTATGRNTARYSYVLPTRTAYSVDVGCGGTSRHWSENDRTTRVAGVHYVLSCVGPAHLGGTTEYGICTQR